MSREEFTWELPVNEHHPPLHKSKIGKLVAKVPMCKAVVTEDNRLYEYHILGNGRVMYQYVATVIDTY